MYRLIADSTTGDQGAENVDITSLRRNSNGYGPAFRPGFPFLLGCLFRRVPMDSTPFVELVFTNRNVTQFFYFRIVMNWKLGH